jgi:hypothetical protein
VKIIINAILIISVLALLAGCVVTSDQKTRSFMTEDEIAEVNKEYYQEEGTTGQEETAVPRQPERTLEPFLIGFEGPVMTVNGLDVMAADVRALYEYYASYRDEDMLQLEQDACMHYILVYAVMSQWPDKIQPAIDRLNEIKSLVSDEVDFSNLVVENTQDPEGVDKRGDYGERTRGQMTDIYGILSSRSTGTNRIRVTPRYMPVSFCCTMALTRKTAT